MDNGFDRRRPPPLPPRAPSAPASPSIEPPPRYSSIYEPREHDLLSSDDRNASTQSLVSPVSNESNRRKLLLIYIHGFMGNEASFQSFPAHVHNVLSVTMGDTHVVHTKIYPRYKCRKAIEFARDDFSSWLAPHESPTTDVILLGHSLGGFLGAEVVLLAPRSRTTGGALRHRIIGTINFDVPFLGLHPGVVISGIGSLFRPAVQPPGTQQEQGGDASSLTSMSQYTLDSQDSGPLFQQATLPDGVDPLFSHKPNDPNFNPSFANDVVWPVRKGWNSALHFITKHSDNIARATKQYVTSHLEFGSTIGDYRGMKSRYIRIRALEEADERARMTAVDHVPPGATPPSRVRFLNYYTASTGRPKKDRSPSRTRVAQLSVEAGGGEAGSVEQAMQSMTLNAASGDIGSVSSRSTSPQPMQQSEAPQSSALGYISTESHQDNPPLPIPEAFSPAPSALSENPAEPLAGSTASQSGTSVTAAEAPEAVPDIPPLPTEPPFFNPAAYPDKPSRKAAEKEHDLALKTYKRAIKERNAAMKARDKVLVKRGRDAGDGGSKDIARAPRPQLTPQPTTSQDPPESAAQAQTLPNSTSNSSTPAHLLRIPPAPVTTSTLTTRPRSPSPHPATPPRHSLDIPSARSGSPQSTHSDPYPAATQAETKPRRERKFCMLPPKDARGERDPTWVKVRMEGVDEVGAHCGLFFVGDTYERLVGDVAARVEEWVKLDAGGRGSIW